MLAIVTYLDAEAEVVPNAALALELGAGEPRAVLLAEALLVPRDEVLEDGLRLRRRLPQRQKQLMLRPREAAEDDGEVVVAGGDAAQRRILEEDATTWARRLGGLEDSNSDMCGLP